MLISLLVGLAVQAAPSNERWIPVVSSSDLVFGIDVGTLRIQGDERVFRSVAIAPSGVSDLGLDIVDCRAGTIGMVEDENSPFGQATPDNRTKVGDVGGVAIMIYDRICGYPSSVDLDQPAKNLDAFTQSAPSLQSWGSPPVKCPSGSYARSLDAC